MKLSKTLLFISLLLLLVSGVFSPASSQKLTSGNPVLKGRYADPEGIILNNEYWIFPTYSAKYEDQIYFDAFSSKDLVSWKKHPKIVDTSAIKWAKKAMWAPCIVQKGKKYFLFFSANDIQTPDRSSWNPKTDREDQIGGIGIGVAAKPEGPYKDYLGKPLIGKVFNKAQPIDQFVFKDKDNQYYIIYGGWGHCNIGKLNKDFTALTPLEDGKQVKEITPKGYVEGPVMFLRNGKYYLMWSEGNWTDETYKVAYAIADTPFGPFDKKETILVADPAVATGAGHHSVINIPNTDEWYIVYHRRPIPNVDRDHREVCIDKMYFNKDGSIKNVKMTFEGVSRKTLK